MAVGGAGSTSRWLIKNKHEPRWQWEEQEALQVGS